MVSPSKLQQQKQQATTHSRHQHHQRSKQPIDRISTSKSTRNLLATSLASPASPASPVSANIIRIQRGPKPLEKKTFYLDIKNHGLSAKLESRIKELGGGIELFLVEGVNLVVTDRVNRPGQATTNERCKWGYNSGGSGGPPSLRSIEVQTPIATPPTPYRSVEGPLSNSTNQRGQPTQRSKSRVDAMLERALTQPQQCSVDPLNNALNWSIPVWSTYELQSWLEKITASLKSPHSLTSDSRVSSAKDFSVRHLKEPYIKFESYRRDSRPAFVELQLWPTINFDGDPGSCPFDVKRREKKEVVSVVNEIKENREKYCVSNTSKGKDMTRRPRATATRSRKTENTGYCEICRIEYRNLTKHLQSDQHLNFVRNDKNFISLDNLINTGASVEAFLKINRSKDVREDRSLFTSHDHGLDNGILSADEKPEKKDKSNLNDFAIDDLKMMQCNGARRNLNLDSSSHNLRARAKHESGHLLRSKGRPFSEGEKSDKSLDKYVIKKRSKGTYWIEENSSEDEKDVENEVISCDKKGTIERLCDAEIARKVSNGEVGDESLNGDVSPDAVVDGKRKENSSTSLPAKENALGDCFLESQSKAKVNGYEKKEDGRRSNDLAENKDAKQDDEPEVKADCANENEQEPNNGEHLVAEKSVDVNTTRNIKKSRRTMKGRPRLSVEERLIEDNRGYYKVEVLENKLRSSAIPCPNAAASPSKEPIDKPKTEEKPSSEKKVQLRFKRVRKSELTLLSDEAETFMFGEQRRDDDSSGSDDEQSSILPVDTESDGEGPRDSTMVSSSPAAACVKQEITDDDSQDSSGRGRKKRRTQAEALLKDNTDYYKFEIPGSRLRFQAPLTGICEPTQSKDWPAVPESSADQEAPIVYPSKPSPEIEKMHFSFEAVPRSESWYQTYQRQDEGEEFYYYSSEPQKPFLLPYEIDNFDEILRKSIQNGLHRKRGRSKGSHIHISSRTPRKSPRCHASTLAIMSTIIKRKEQPPTNLDVIDEGDKPKPTAQTAKPENKPSEKSDVDADIFEYVKGIEDELGRDYLSESFDIDLEKSPEEAPLELAQLQPKGAPVDLLELLDNCHERVNVNGLENSSCASSDCGELGSESPSKRRKKRKNKTGWPGNKMRRKLHVKHLSDDAPKDVNLTKKTDDQLQTSNLTAGESLEEASSHVSHDEDEAEIGKENEQVQSQPKSSKRRKSQKTKNRDNKEFQSSSQTISEAQDAEETAPKSTVTDKASSKKRQTSASFPHPKVKIEPEEEPEQEFEVGQEEVEENNDDDDDDDDDDVETLDVKRARHPGSKGRTSSISEDSEESVSNRESVCAKKRSAKKLNKQRQRNNTTSSEASLQTEVDSCQHDCGASSSPRKRPKDRLDIQEYSSARSTPKKTRLVDVKNKRQKNERTPSKTVFENENCKKRSPPSANERRKHKRSKRNDSVSSELPNGDMSDRVSLVSASDVDQRRSSIDFQPVVRVTKIDSPAENNRRLRSSSSPRSSKQPPKKRARHSSGRR